MNFIVRQMIEEDTKAVQDVARKSWNATYEGIIPSSIQENFLNTAYSDEMMERRLKGSLLLVAEVNDGIVGFANYSPVKSEGKVELGSIYIYPEYQGAGIGTALLKEGIALSTGVKEIYINVEKDNFIGKNFYKAKGFSFVEVFDDDFDGHILRTERMVLLV